MALQEIKEQDEKIHNLIYKDELTGINNRCSLFQLIDEALECKNNNGILAVIFLDIDNFKYINDSCGHDVGDKVIEIAGNRLKQFENHNISLGRFGGDEFVFLTTNSKSIDEIVLLANEIRSCFCDSISVGLNQFCLELSIGIAIADKA